MLQLPSKPTDVFSWNVGGCFRSVPFCSGRRVQRERACTAPADTVGAATMKFISTNETCTNIKYNCLSINMQIQIQSYYI